MDKAAFLRWVQTQERAYELIGGRVVMQDTGTRDHSQIGLAFYDVLRPRLSRQVWTIHVGQLSVEIGEEIRVADVIVEQAGLEPKSIASDQAVLIVEVLSPSTKGADFNGKRKLYSSLPSLEIYIVASQDEPRLWIWQRGRDAARAFPDIPVEISEGTAEIDLSYFGISFNLNEIYQHIFLS